MPDKPNPDRQSDLLLRLRDLASKDPEKLRELESMLDGIVEQSPSAAKPLAAPSVRRAPLPVSGPPSSAPARPLESAGDQAGSVPPVLAKSHKAVKPPKMKRWSKLGGGALTFAILFHLILVIIAAFWVFQIIRPPEKKVDFMPPGGGGGERGAEYQVQQKKRAQITPVTNVKRVFAEGATSDFTLPEPGENFGEMSALSSLSGGGMSGGLGGSGSGKGFGKGSGNGAGSGLGAGTGKIFGIPNLFGQKQGEGIKGVFHDFKLDRDQKPTGADTGMGNYVKILQAFKRGGWGGTRFPHYSPEAKLRAKFFFFPAIQDKQAATAFDSADSGPGLWVAHYTGRVSASAPGTYRFVGWGDNVLAVKINRKIVLDASDVGVFEEQRESVGKVSLPGKNNTPMFAGDWVRFGTGEVDIEVVIGDHGGIFCAGLFIQAKDQPLQTGAGGLPNLPLFLMGDLSEQEIKLLNQVPQASLAGPVFRAKTIGPDL